MNTPRPTEEPQSLVAGDTLQFDRDIDNFLPADGWALSYALICAGNAPIFINGGMVTSTGSTFNVNVPGSTTEAWTPGKYQWAALITGIGNFAGQRFTVGTGAIEIKPDPAHATDLRSDAKRNLDAIDAVLQKRAGADVQSYEIHGRKLVKMQLKELLQLRSYFAQIYKQERIQAGETFPSPNVGVCFS